MERLPAGTFSHSVLTSYREPYPDDWRRIQRASPSHTSENRATRLRTAVLIQAAIEAPPGGGAIRRSGSNWRDLGSRTLAHAFLRRFMRATSHAVAGTASDAPSSAPAFPLNTLFASDATMQLFGTAALGPMNGALPRAAMRMSSYQRRRGIGGPLMLARLTFEVHRDRDVPPGHEHVIGLAGDLAAVRAGHWIGERGARRLHGWGIRHDRTFNLAHEGWSRRRVKTLIGHRF